MRWFSIVLGVSLIACAGGHRPGESSARIDDAPHPARPSMGTWATPLNSASPLVVNETPGASPLATSGATQGADCASASAIVQKAALARLDRQIDRAIRDVQEGPLACAPAGGHATLPADPAACDDPTFPQPDDSIALPEGRDDYFTRAGGRLYALGSEQLSVFDATSPTGLHETGAFRSSGARIVAVDDRVLLFGGRCNGFFCPQACEPDGGRRTSVQLVNAGAATPHVVRELAIGGDFVAAQRVGKKVIAVFARVPARFPLDLAEAAYDFDDTCGIDEAKRKKDAVQAYERLRTRTHALVAGTNPLGQLPDVVDSASSSLSCEAFAAAPGAVDHTALGAFTSVVTFDLGSDEAPVHSATLVGGALTQVAFDGEDVFVATALGGEAGADAATEVSVFHTHDKPAVGASTTIRGGAIALGADGAHATVVTADGAATAAVRILESNGAGLSELGGVGGLPLGAGVDHVSIDRDYAILVPQSGAVPKSVVQLDAAATVRRVDLPGVPTFTRMLDATHLLTVAADATPIANGWSTPGTIQIFDVSDPSKPRAVASAPLDASAARIGLGSARITFDAGRGLLAAPIVSCGPSDAMNASPQLFDGIALYDVAPNGVALRGRITAARPDIFPTPSTCLDFAARWDASGHALFDGDVVYSVSGGDRRFGLVKVDALAAVGTDIAAVLLP
jgi:hypothetical protein